MLLNDFVIICPLCKHSKMYLRCNFFSFWDIYDVPTSFSVISMLKHGIIVCGSMLNGNTYYQNLTDARCHDEIQDYLSTVARIAHIVSHSNWQT